MRVPKLIAGPLIVALTVVGCTQDGSNAHNVAAQPATDVADVAAEQVRDVVDSGQVGCTQDLQALCAMPGAGCVDDWSTALRMAMASPSSPEFVRYWVKVCGDYNVLLDNGFDTGEDDYYDKTTGKLVAVVASSSNCGCQTCAGGPADFVISASCSPSTPVAHPAFEGGVEGGPFEGDAGMDALFTADSPSD
jgi:hypothetical protein